MITTPLPYDPYWTEMAFSSGRGRDALGIETHGELILTHLLPGINNQTSRTRYFPTSGLESYHV